MPEPEEQETTGPSSEPVQPIITVGQTTAPVLRTTGQGVTGLVVIQAIDAFGIYTFNDEQFGVAVVIATAAMSWLQNTIEKRNGRRLLGTAQ